MSHASCSQIFACQVTPNTIYLKPTRSGGAYVNAMVAVDIPGDHTRFATMIVRDSERRHMHAQFARLRRSTILAQWVDGLLIVHGDATIDQLEAQAEVSSMTEQTRYEHYRGIEIDLHYQRARRIVADAAVGMRTAA